MKKQLTLTPQQDAINQLNGFINEADKIYVMRQYYVDGSMRLQVTVKKPTERGRNVTRAVAQAFDMPLPDNRGIIGQEYPMIEAMCEKLHNVRLVLRIEVTADMKVINYEDTVPTKAMLC